MARIRARTIRHAHRRFGAVAAALSWPGPSSPLRTYLLAAAPEHWWMGGKRGRARRLLVQPGYLSARLEQYGRYELLELWRALGEKRCVKALLTHTEADSAATIDAADWARMGDFLQIGSHRRTVEPLLDRALSTAELSPLERARLMRTMAGAIWESGTTDSETERALAILEDALGLISDPPDADEHGAHSDEELAIAAAMATVGSDVDEDHGRSRYEAVLALQQAAGVCTKSTRMNLANAHHHAGELDRALTLLEGVATELDHEHGAEWPAEWIVLMHNIAAVHQTKEDHAAARDRFVQTRNRCADFYGPAHPRTLDVEGFLVRTLVACGDLDAAAERMESAMRVALREHGPTGEWTRLIWDGAMGMVEEFPATARCLGAADAIRDRLLSLGSDAEARLEAVVDAAHLAMGEGRFWVAEVALDAALDRAVVAHDAEGLAWAIEHWIRVREELERDDSAAARVLGVLADARAAPELADRLRAVEDEVLPVLIAEDEWAEAWILAAAMLEAERDPMTLYRAADVQRGLGEPRAAADLREACLEAELEDDELTEDSVLETLIALCDDLQHADDEAGARVWAQRALDALAEEGEDADPEWIEAFQEVLDGV